MDSSCKKFLSAHPELQFFKDTGKIRCSLSGHEMPCRRVDVLKAYVSGKKFTKLKAEHDFNYSQLEPFLVLSKKRKKQLFCALTNRYVNRKPDEVKSHVNGQRYKRAMEKYNGGEVLLFEERLRKSVKTVQEEEEVVEEEKEEEASEILTLHGQRAPSKKEMVPLQKDTDEDDFWEPNSTGEEGAEPDQLKDDDDGRDEVMQTKKESSSLGREKKRKRITRAVGSVKRKKLGSSESKSRGKKQKTNKVN